MRSCVSVTAVFAAGLLLLIVTLAAQYARGERGVREADSLLHLSSGNTGMTQRLKLAAVFISGNARSVI